MELFLALVKFILGLVFLIVSADKFIISCIHISERFNLPRALVGLTLVAFGTSLPELVLTITASLKGESDIALGNVIGSNISNIGLVYATALVASASMVGKSNCKKDILALLVVTTICSGMLFYFNTLTMVHGLVLLLLGLSCTIYFWKFAKEEISSPSELPEESLKKSALILLISTAIIPISANYLLDGGVEIAQYFGISTLVIGLVFMAIGTSLPELATSISAAMRKEKDLVVGNIIGSNIFNITLVLGAGALTRDIKIPKKAAHFDNIIMWSLTAVFAIALYFNKIKLRYFYIVFLLSTFAYFIYAATTK